MSNLINNKIVKLVLELEGEKELKNNSGWENKKLEDKMIISGWQEGQAWCAYLTETIWCDAFKEINPKLENSLRKLFSANAVMTYNNFYNSNFITSDEPVNGAVVIWKKVKNGQSCFIGNTQWITGHAGLVINDKEGQTTFTTLEGNSNSSGGREGIEIARQERDYSFAKENGLQLMGFIHPKII